MKCVYCHHPLGWGELRDASEASGTFTCPRCTAVLRLDKWFAALWFMGVLIPATLAAAYFFDSIGLGGMAPAGLISLWLVFAGVFTVFFHRSKVVQPGIRYCPGCGYDLRGAVRGGGFMQCPECGTKVGKPAHEYRPPEA